MKPEWFPVYLILGFLVFQFLLKRFYPIFVILHELGHALPARCFGKQQIQIHIGNGPLLLQFRLCSLQFEIHVHDQHTGYTRYTGTPETYGQAFAIILIAPLFSLTITLISAALLYQWASHVSAILVFILTAAWLSNFHITFSSLWPVKNPHSDIHAFRTTLSILKSSLAKAKVKLHT